MSRFDDLRVNKNKIIEYLHSNSDIVKCLKNSTSDFLDQPLPEGYDPSSLVYNKIFPYKYIPGPQIDPQTFISIRFNYKPEGLVYKNGLLCFYIITHNSLIQTDYGTLRSDYLVNKIDEIFHSSKEIGIGKLQFYHMHEFIVNDNYYGAYLAYKTTGFQ